MVLVFAYELLVMVHGLILEMLVLLTRFWFSSLVYVVLVLVLQSDVMLSCSCTLTLSLGLTNLLLVLYLSTKKSWFC